MKSHIIYSRTGSIITVLLLFVTVISCNQNVTGSADNIIQSAAVTSTANSEGGDPCDPGFFSVDGLTLCEPAPVGRFVPEAGATEAIDCPAGKYQDETGQTNCKPAEPGTFVSVEGAAQAEKCDLGTYQDLAGQTSCKVAEPGSFVNFKGAAASSLCAIGTFSSFAGAAECTACTVGETTDGPGATVCILAVNDPTSKADCKKGGWDEYGFKNQGQCIRFVNTGKDSR